MYEKFFTGSYIVDSCIQDRLKISEVLRINQKAILAS